MSEVVALLSQILAVLLFQLGVSAFIVGFLFVSHITRHWGAR